MARGTLRIFLGAAPGVGKTFAMLEEAHGLLGKGHDVVVALVMDHGRVGTRALLDGLEVVPPKVLSYRGTSFEEMDIDAVLARKPATAIVDEYAHSNIPGSRHEKRWQDIEELLDAGINVHSTVNVQHLASLGDVVSAIAGVKQSEAVPDDIVRRADQIDLVDISPELLRQRLSEGSIYAPDKIDAALSNYFRLGNLTALRELALLWLADRVDEGLSRYRAENNIVATWPARQRIVVGLTGGTEGEVLIRRAARALTRVSGGDLLAVHVRDSDGGTSESPRSLEAQRQLVADLGGSYHTVAGDDAARALLDFARSVNATQIVIGVSQHKAMTRLFAGAGIGARVVRGSGDIDVLMVSHPLGAKGTGSQPRGALGRRRVASGFALAVVLPVLLQVVLGQSPEHNVGTAALLQLTGSVTVALVGGLWPAILAAMWSSLLVNYFSTPPLGTLTISDPQNVLALLVFVGVSTAVALVVDRSARRSKEAARARVEAVTLSELARGAVRSADSLTALLDQAVDVFQVRSAALFTAETSVDPGAAGGDDVSWHRVAAAGENPPDSMADAENIERIDAATALVLTGRTLPASDRRLLSAFAAHVTALQERKQLSMSRRENLRLAEGNTMRTAILRAVSHDLRTPLTGIKLAVSSLRQTGVRFTQEEEKEMLATIEDYTDRLDLLVGNLLDMSRITSDAVNPLLRPLRWYEVLPGALQGVPPGSVRVDLAPNMPEIDADAGMLERVIANIVENAHKYAPNSDIVIVGTVGGLGTATIKGRPTGELRIIDHGQGVPAENVVAMFRPFQRLDDIPSVTGVGLGLAVAKGFLEAMGGTLTAEPTPGGGLTMVIRLPLSTGTPWEGTHDAVTTESQSVLKAWKKPELHLPGQVKKTS
ncbi:two-component system sensor histidine kinase KdpD [Arthrobacter pascens]|uniref:DUF4118 domain-containing protein n=1 Tax=Arthrobacter pascens TaxID=1677 RepID=UPI0027812450|nr:DUF4118 domain-containing protein [Arthrobacter pascens]MDQ0632774.1 two-component system sensor histidine kinase KdpD [Arthrobacter pascens]